MPPDQIIPFLIFAFVAAVTPGPSNLLVLAAGASAGFVGGLRCLAGVVVGMTMLMAFANLGLGNFTEAYPQSLNLLKWAGSAFLLWLAWKVGSTAPMSAASNTIAVGFWKAFVFQWVNPKSWIVSLSAVSVYGNASENGIAAQAFQMSGLFAFAATVSCALWLAFGGSIKRWLVNDYRSRLFNCVMGLFLAVSVILVFR